MGRLWCRDLTVVQVPRADVPKPVTIVLPYYENRDFFARQAAHWSTWPESVRAHVSAVVVDDGSPEPARVPYVQPFPIRLFRIGCDVRWNWLAARNIGAHHAPDGWLLLTDMDHMIPAATMDAVVTGQHDPDVVYVFQRRESTGEPVAPHSASFLMTRAMFWRIGGYDEALSGYYGTDGDYRRRVARVARIQILPQELTRYEYIGDSSTTRYRRKQPQDAAVRQIIASRGRRWQPRTLSFPYHEVTA